MDSRFSGVIAATTAMILKLNSMAECGICPRYLKMLEPFKMVSRQKNQYPRQTRSKTTCSGEIVFKDVTFAYNNKNVILIYILKQVKRSVLLGAQEVYSHPITFTLLSS